MDCETMLPQSLVNSTAGAGTQHIVKQDLKVARKLSYQNLAHELLSRLSRYPPSFPIECDSSTSF